MPHDQKSESDGWLQRQRPISTYRLPPLPLLVPAAVVAATIEWFAVFAKRRLESACFWYGTLDADVAHVTAVVLPGQENSWGNYQISAEAMQRVSACTRPLGLRNLAQLHTHPGVNVEHSSYDDLHANSRKALSLVFPHYGHWASDWPQGIGIHEYQEDGWHYLVPADAHQRVMQIMGPKSTEVIDAR